MNRLKFGYQQPSHLFPEGRIFQNLSRVARECEEQGYDSFWLMDHLIQIPIAGDAMDPIMEAYTTLSALAVATSTLKLGVLCTCNTFRNPALVAKMGATLDVISDGRFWLGIGAGWFRGESRMCGYEFPDSKTRLEMLAESLEIITRAWTEDGTTFQGRHFQVRDLVLRPKPVRKPRPPILVGGDGEKVTLKLAAKYADACNLLVGENKIKAKLESLRNHCGSVGRDYSSVLKTKLASVMFGDSRKDALSKIEKLKPQSFTLEEYVDTFLLGTPSQVAEQVGKLGDLGIEYLMINFRGKYNSKDKETFSREVMPSV